MPEQAPEAPARDSVALNAMAADYITRFVGSPAHVARGNVAELIDSEVDAVIAAGSDRHTAKQEILDILTRAYDRRREVAAKEAQREMDDLRRSAQAQRAIERFSYMTTDQAAVVVVKLHDDELASLAALVDDPDGKEKATEILLAAEARIASESKPEEPAAEEKPADEPAPAPAKKPRKKKAAEDEADDAE
jgi:hypothetical protein